MKRIGYGETLVPPQGCVSPKARENGVCELTFHAFGAVLFSSGHDDRSLLPVQVDDEQIEGAFRHTTHGDVEAADEYNSTTSDKTPQGKSNPMLEISET